jgi:malate permease and related proteins
MEFLTILLPIFMIFAIGFIGQKWIGFDIRSLSTMAMYLMSPVLVFRTFYQLKFEPTYVYMILHSALLCISLIGIVYLIGWWKGYTTTEICGLILASVFMNNGNYGTPLVLFVFGEKGLHYAVFLMVIQALIMCTVGVYYAAKGSPEHDGVRSALRAVQRMPIVYGALAGMLLHMFQVPLAPSLMQAVNMVADATIPTIMIILGMQLATISIRSLSVEKLSYSLALRMLISPVIAFAITWFLPMEPLLKQILILMAAMPTAANTTLYAVQFRTEPDFVSSATLISTNLSILTLPVLLSLLM